MIGLGKDAPLDSKLLNNTLHSSVMSEYNKATTRVKFKGGQFVVAASHHFVRTYPTPGGRSLTRVEYMKDESTQKTVISSTSGMIATDPVFIGGVEMPLWRAEKEGLITEDKLKNSQVQAKVLPESEELKWMRYTSDGKPLEEFKEYIDLVNAVVPEDGTDEEKEKALRIRAELEVKLQELLSDKSKNWVTKDSEFYMPQVHAQAYNLDKDDTLLDIMGNNVEGSQEERNSMIDFFTDKIRDNSDKYGLKRFRNVKNLKVEHLNKMQSTTMNEVMLLEEGTNEYNIKSEQLSTIERILNNYKESNGSDNIEDVDIRIINNQRSIHKEFVIKSLAEAQADNFPKTLQIIASRIPGQGKQSYTAGRIKGFVTSQRNTIYGPLEMLTITGADHDVDKSSVITYSVDDYGVLYTADKFLVNGKISKDKWRSQYKEKRNKYVKSLELSNTENIEARLADFDKREYNYLSEATKNYITEKLLDTARNPENAIEASTPVSVDRVSDQVAKVVDYIINDGKLEFTSEDSYSPTNPISIPLLEIVNTSGKSGVGIFATGLKTFSALFTAQKSGIENNSKFVEFKNEVNVLFGAQKSKAKDLYNKLYPDTKNGLHLYKGRSRKSVRTIANTEKYYKDMIRTARETRELELEPKAWEDLSVLLSAATDNAKELLLARIGATDNTSGIIAAGIMMGFDLTDMLDLLKNDDIKSILKKVDDSTDFTSESQDRITLESALNDYLEVFNALDMEIDYAKKNIIDSEEAIKNTELENKSTSEVKEYMNLKSIKDAVVYSVTDYNANVDSFGVKTKTIENSIPTESELNELKDAIADSSRVMFDYIDKSEAVALMKVIKLGTHVVSNTSYDSNVARALAKKFNKPFYSVGQTGKWSRDEKLISSQPLLTSGFVFLTNGADLFSSELSSIQKSVEYSKEVISDPSIHRKTVNKIVKDLTKLSEKDKVALDDVMHNYLSDGPRQLLQFHKIAEELRTFSGVLAINGGLPNGSWDTYNYLNKFVSKINKISGSEDFMTFDKFRQFIESSDNDVTSEDIIKEFETFKTGMNPFFTLKENKHYFGYIKGLFAARDIIKSSTFTTEAIEKLSRTIGNIDVQEKLSSLENYVYGLGITSFFNKTDYAKSFSLGGIKYNLSDRIDRNKFMLDMVDIKKSLDKDESINNNAFIKALRIETLKDNITKEVFPILRTRNLMSTEEHNRVKIKQGLTQLKKKGGDYEEFHDALYFYSLILNKGGVGSKSFASLFDSDLRANKDYLNHLNTLDSDLIMQMATKYDSSTYQDKDVVVLASQLANPLTIKERSTVKKAVFIEDAPEGFNQKINNRNTLNDNDYNLPSTNKKYGMLFKSAQTGKIYLWNQSENGYVVITPQSFSHKGNTYKVSNRSILQDNNKPDMMSSVGYEFGETAKVGKDNSYGQVYSFNRDSKSDNYEKYRIKFQNGNFGYMTQEDLQALNPDMLFYRNNFGKVSGKVKESKSLDTKGVKSYDVKFPYKATTLLGGGGIPNRVLDGVTRFSTTSDLEVSKGDTRLVDFGDNDWYEVTNLGKTSDYIFNNNIEDKHAFLQYGVSPITDNIVKKATDPKLDHKLYEVVKYTDEVDMSMVGKGKAVTPGVFRTILEGINKNTDKSLSKTDKKIIDAELDYLEKTFGKEMADVYFQGIEALPEKNQKELNEILFALQPTQASEILNVSKEYLKLSSKATIAYGLGTSKWVSKYNKALQPESVTNISPNDKVWFFGDSISDGTKYAAVVRDNKKLIDRVAKVGADILIGKNNGVEEEIKTYLMDKYPGYTPTEDGFVNNIKRDVKSTPVFKDMDANRFNANKTFTREKIITGPYGTVTYKSSSDVPEGSKATQYSLYTKEVAGWTDVRDNSFTSDIAETLTESVGKNDWDSVRDESILEESNYIRKLLAAAYLTSTSKVKIKSEEDLNVLINSKLQSDKDFNEYISEIFNDKGDLAISNTLQLAMARDRFVTNNYFQERFPELFSKNNSPILKTLNESKYAKMLTPEWKNIIGSNVLSTADLSLISKDNELQFRDTYHYLSTLGANKAYTSKGRSHDTELNNILVSKGIKAISSNEKITVLDNDAILKFEASSKNNKLNTGDKAQKSPVSYTNKANRDLTSRKVSKTVMRKVFLKLADQFDTDSSLLTELDIKAEYGDVYSKLSGWTTAEGEVIINIDRATLDTPLHEFGGHIFMNKLKVSNPDMYERIINEALESDIAQDIADTYTQLDRNGVGEEVFSTLFGLNNQGKLLTERSMGVWNRITNLATESNSIAEFIREAVNVIFGVETDYSLDMNDSLMDIINKLGNDIVFGDSSIMSELSSGVKSDLEYISNPTDSRTEIIEKLKKLNSIKRICI